MSQLKAWSNSFLRYVKVDLPAFDAEYKQSRETIRSVTHINVQIRDLEAIWDKISSLFEKINESTLLVDPKEAEKIELSELTEQFLKTKGYYRNRIIALEEALAEVEHKTEPRQTITPEPTHTPEETSIHVSPCDIPIFDGEFENWATFRDLFTAIIVNNKRKSGIEKLCYLKGKVRKRAREIVDDAPSTNEGFDIAWRGLKKEYENERKQVGAQFGKLLNLPTLNVQCGKAIRGLQRIVNSAILTLETLDFEKDRWGDAMIVFTCMSKLPKETLVMFERSLSDNTVVPSWEQLDEFLTAEYRGLESATDAKALFSNQTHNQTQNTPHNHNPRHKQFQDNRNSFEKRGKTFLNVTQEPNKNTQFKKSPKNEQNSSNFTQTHTKSDKPDGAFCKLCKEKHTLANCSQFTSMLVSERIDFVKKNGVCYNCLAIAHSIKDCRSKFTCRHCGGRHNSLIHKPSNTPNTRSIQDDLKEQSTSKNAQSFATTANSKTLYDRKKLLGTAVLNVEIQGALFPARALIDPASDYSFVTEKLRRKLRLSSTPIAAEFSGLEELGSARSNKLCDVTVRSNTQNNFSLTIQAIVVKGVSNNLPTHKINSNVAENLEDITLADPQFYDSRPVDLLIGSDYYPQILLSGVKNKFLNTLIAQETQFGWILTGPVEEAHKPRAVVSFFNTVTLDECLTKFWEVEEVPRKPIKSLEDSFCEEHYQKTTQRLPNGRYQVDLPFRTPQMELGNSRHIAMAQYLRNEKNLMKNSDLKAEYDNALLEYIELGHMKPVPYDPKISSNDYYYLPHHAVVKPDRVTTKVRVVFNASSKTANSNSLNDALYTGPILQQDLVVLMLKWRFYKIVFNADITKMYRQILLNPTHTPYQRILFRKSVNERIIDYEFQTVTFGVNCAPYLAIRTLHELAKDVQNTHPIASQVLRENMYVDDVLAGAHTIEEAKIAQQQLITVMDSAGFPLRKWISNTAELLESLPDDHLLDVDLLTLPESHNAKTLGIRWNAKDDLFFFNVPIIERKTAYTKRAVLSDIARLFDPAGWLAPIIVSAKIIMQQIWQDKTGWDECLKPLTLIRWQSFLRYYDNINKIRIPRWIQFLPSAKIEFHGFSDASEKAYSAVLYARVTPIDGPNTVTLLCAKTRVAPIKTLSIPKLELCGAVLLANMVKNVLSQLNLPQHQTYFWTDSSIVLAWLKRTPSSWKTFVANRVATISETVGVDNWNHVVSHDNPADIASRGSTADELMENTLWWNGPSWLQGSAADWPTSTQSFETQAEAKIQCYANTVTIQTDILQDFSKWSRALRVLSYVYRFCDRILNTRRSLNRHQRLELDRSRIPSMNDRLKSLLSHKSIQLEASEIKSTQDKLVVLCQNIYFKEEYDCLKSKKPIRKKSTLLTLTPFLDSKKIIRANGRLASSKCLSYDERHPIILPYNSCFAKLLTKHVHFITLHGGNQTMLRIIRAGFWIPKLKNLIRSVIHQCSPCTRYKHRQTTQLMAALPPERTELSRPFTNTGVDFAGPFDVKAYSGRSCKITKGYVCVFFCFATKAIHLEPTSDLSTQAFMAAFSRFFSRRGCPAAIYSDNGTNFVGASQLLKRERQEFIRGLQESVVSTNSFQHVQWHFIPPGAPHMGGLWEAGVKSFKFHLKRTATTKYTFEELFTLLAKIEACLNSRPLSPSSENSQDLNPLTPGHFLIGSPLLSPAEPDSSQGNPALANRWEKLKIQHHYFCKRWKDEYLKELHKRYKWKYPQRQLETDDLVVIKQDNLAPNEWQLGRVIKVSPSSDSRVRVVQLRTSTGILKRPITKVVVLPTN